MKITITKKDIEKSGYGYNDCPIACALKRYLKTKVHKYIAIAPRGRNFIFIGKTRLPLNKDLLIFTGEYDASVRKKTKPTSFELKIPEKYIK